MRADLAARDIARRLPAEFSVVAQPDLPHLLSGPDLLVAFEGKLVAAFLLHGAEKKNPQALWARLIACRLVLPRRTRCILLVQERDESDDVTPGFDFVFRATEHDQIRRYVR